MFRFLGKIVSNLLAMIVAICLLIGGCVFVIGTAAKNGGSVKAALDGAEKSFATGVAQDLIEQYDIVKNGSDEMAKSVRAGAVAEMYLQARDQANYEAWKAKADGHMKAAMGN